MNRIFFSILMGLVCSTDITAQTSEEEAWKDAQRALVNSPANTIPVELFLQRYPTSQYRGDATLALEAAQVLTRGRFDVKEFSYVTVPSLSQLKPSEQALQYFIDNQNDFAALRDGSLDASRKQALKEEIRKRCRQVLNSDNREWNDEAEFTLGYLDYVDGNLDDALNYWEGLPEEEKYEESLPFYRAQILMAKGRWDEARASVARLKHRAVLNREQSLEIARIEGECYLQEGQTVQASPLLEAYVNQGDPANVLPSSAYNCALLAYRNGNHPLAQKAAKLSIQNGKNDDAVMQYAQLLLGKSMLETGNWEEARMAFEQAALSNADIEAKEAAEYNRIATIHQNAYSPFGDEVTLLENFLNTYPNSKYADQVSEYLSEVYMTSRNYETALQSVRKIKHPNARVQQAKQRLLFQLGAQNYVNGKYKEAENQLTECLSIGSYPEAYFWRGEARYHQQNFAGAEKDWTKFLTQRDTKFDLRLLAQYDLGYARFRQNDFAGAVTAFSSYIADLSSRGTETYLDAMTRMADCYYYQRDFAKAESYYRNARLTSPRSNGADWDYFQEAFMMGLQKKYTEKANALTTLVKEYPTSDWCDEALLELGKTRILQDQKGAAIHAFQQVLTDYPNGNCAPQAALQLAMVYNNQGQTQAAMKSYKQVIEQWPHTDEARMALEDIKVLYLDQNDVRGYDQYLSTVSGGEGLTGAERDSLNMISAARLSTQGNTAKAYEIYQQILSETNNEALRREVMPVALSQAYNLEKYSDVTTYWEAMKKMQGLPTLTVTESQLMAAKAYQVLGNQENYTAELSAVAKDIRTAPGAEAKYLLAQQAFDQGDTLQAKNMATEMMQQGTPHAYWMARDVILLTDILSAEGDSFQAEAYLKSLQANYKAKDDIQEMIEQRLTK